MNYYPLNYRDQNTVSVAARVIPNARVRWLLYWSCWIAIGSLATVHWYYLFPSQHDYPWLPLLRNKLGIWLLWGCISIFIWWLSSRYQISRLNLIRNILSLFAWSVVVVATFLVLWAMWIYVISGPENPVRDYRYMLQYAIGMHSTFYFLAFWATVGLEQALRIFGEYHRKDLATSELKAELASLNLERLRSQLQPHFLFNALNTISSMVLRDKKEQAHETLVDLSDLLRMSLDYSAAQFVKFGQELAFIDRYLKLFAARFPGRITFKVDIAPHLLEAEVPSLLLQPLIENAVKHGITEGSDLGIIELRAKRSHDVLHIELSNTVADSRSDQENNRGIGISNTQERLFHLYGNDAELSMVTNPDSRVTITITIPYCTGSSHH